eukprot:TRINITY_DN5660_c0_g1_i4.p1 TRINITY_DN5660_c0_g1~~TRINITY_DN5660_c0_g1_i4.p1  ORF type:complete len:455 (+),score=47.83 TRINITY_DN5660_c0_g1_i4:115-1479(+)
MDGARDGGRQETRLNFGYLVFTGVFPFAYAYMGQTVQNVGLPSQMATVAGQYQNTALGMCAALGVGTQLLQPVVGTLSDRYGYRQAWVMGGQLALSLSCLGMLLSESVVLLTVTYFTLQLGSTVAFAVYQCLLPAFIPPVQYGIASQMQALMTAIGSVSGSAIGYAYGANWVSLSSMYWSVVALNVLAGVQGLISLSPHRQTILQPTTDPRIVAGVYVDVLDVDGLAGFFSSFRFASFTALFFVVTLRLVNSAVCGTFLVYFLQDRVHVFDVFGIEVASSAESGAAVFNTIKAVSTVLTVNIGGCLFTRIGGKRTVAIDICCTSVLLVPLAFSSSFSVVVICATLLGLSDGIWQAANTALAAFSLPSPENAGRDMNLLQSGPPLSQILISSGGGVMIDYIKKNEGSEVAWAFAWLTSAVLCFLALPTLIPVRERAADVMISPLLCTTAQDNPPK